jgi:hypothetical protein
MIRRRANFQGGTLDATIDDNDTALDSTEFAGLPVIDPLENEYIILVLDPEGIDGDPEVVWITTHTISDNDVTVERGKEGTTARGHNSGTVWVNAPTTLDFATVVNTDGDDPVVIFAGETDPEDNYTVPDGSIWLDTGA